MPDYTCSEELVSCMPAMALRGLTVFPGMSVDFDVERIISLNALNSAMENDRKIFLVTQRDITVEIPNYNDLYSIGVVCNIRQLLKIPGGGVKVLVEGLYRAKIIDITLDKNMYEARISAVETIEKETDDVAVSALINTAYKLFSEYSRLTGNVTKETVLALYGVEDPNYMADFIAQNIAVRVDKKQSVLEQSEPIKRIEYVCEMLANEVEIARLEKDIDKKLYVRLGEQQRANILREQMNVIKQELGMDAGEDDEFEAYREKITQMSLPEEIEAKLLKEVDKLERQPFGSAEATVERNYLDACLELPWNIKTGGKVSVAKARKILDDDHYGLEKVKKRILEFLAVKQYAPDSKGTILCLVGPPGTGKTSIAISIARALDRKLARVALGGVHDEAEIRGHRKTYVGAMPGRIMTAITQVNSSNPLMLLDEIDKLGHDYRGDPAAALLEALDPEQNSNFRDHFLEIPFDLSDVMFITTANDISTIPRPLLDRMEIIELSSYTDIEKLEIAKRHLIPKKRAEHNLDGRALRITDTAIVDIIAEYTRESGVRLLEREIGTICRKTVSKIVDGDAKRITVKPENLEEFLGVRKYKPDVLSASDEVGLVRGLAWTSVGGETLEVEVNTFPGTGRLELTGNLGDVMKESAKAAVSYIRSRCVILGIDAEFYKNTDIHIHFPEGAVPKDGPSAGITMTVAVISALTNTPVRRDIAMTGEISLRGRVMAIGGLKEKTMAALRAGVTTVIIPSDNEKDLEEIDQTVRKQLNFIMASHVDEIIDFVMPTRAKHEGTQPTKNKTVEIKEHQECISTICQ